MDEARFGQQGTLTRVWGEKGGRPTAVKQTRYEWVYLYAAVEPATGEATPMIAPSVNTGTMTVFLGMLSKDLGPDDHAVLIMDQAGWHVSKQLRMPANITGWLLPPYSPELNPIENLFHWFRSHHTANRVFENYQHLEQAIGDAWRSLTKQRLRSICRCQYISATPGK